MPIRVLQVLTCDALGGTELSVATLVERMDPSRVRSTVALLDAPGPVARRLRESGVDVRSLGGRGLALALVGLAGLLRRERFDVVNAYGFRSTAVTRVLVRLLARRARFVNGVRGLHVTGVERVESLGSRAVLALERLGSRLVDVYDANSPGALRLLESAGLDRSRMRYIPNGIDASRWQPNGRPSSSRGGPVILCVARFDRGKRHRDLVLAASRLRREGMPFRVELVGEGATENEVRHLAEGHQLLGTVRFAGRLTPDGVRRALAEADVFCLPSLWEGMPGSVMEAMAAGLPVVGTRVNGIADLVVHGRTGLLVPPERPDLLAAALGELLASPERRAVLGAAGRRRIVEEFPLERMVESKQEMYTTLAGAR